MWRNRTDCGQNGWMDDVKLELASLAARWVVDEGLDFAGAKFKAAKSMGLSKKGVLPDNYQMEDAVRDYIAVFCADSQPGELALLRRLALQWMERLATLNPYLSGAVWHGWATRNSEIVLQLFCDDAKEAEIFLINTNVRYDVGTVSGLHGQSVDELCVAIPVPQWGMAVPLRLQVYDFDDLRGALQPDARGRRPRADLQEVRKLMAEQGGANA